MTGSRHCGPARRVVLYPGEDGPTVSAGSVRAAPPRDGRGPYRMTAEGCPPGLLVEAVAASYAYTLGTTLDRAGLSWDRLEINADAQSATADSGPRLEAVVVTGTIQGGAPRMADSYRRAAKEARDASLAARAIRGNVAYKVGELTIVPPGHHDLVPKWDPRWDPSADRLEALACHHLLAFNSHQERAVLELLHPDCVIEDVALARTCTGRGASVEYYRRWWNAFGAVLIGPRYHTSGTDTATVEACCAGTRRGGLVGCVPTPRSIEVRFTAVLRFAGDLLAAARIYYDTAAPLRQFGLRAPGRRG